VDLVLGSLLGDVFLHLLPHAFNSHDHDHAGHDEKAHAHAHTGGDEKKSVLIGTGIFAGLFFFYAADKFMRAFYGTSGHDHSHGHDHDHGVHSSEEKKSEEQQAVDQVAVREGLRQRNPNFDSKDKEHAGTKEEEKEKEAHHHHHETKTDVRASTYLNLLADFTHNLTDGIAMAASFYASPAVGATTAVAVFFHEIPHEVSDYAILLQSGFSKKRAMMAQFTTAIGAYIGTFIGIFIEEMATRLSHQESHEDSHSHHHHHSHGLLGTSMTWADLIIPATAGGFLYIATVGVIPELLESKSTSNKLQPFKELAAMVFGMALMAGIALSESHHH
jgi:zinc transporter 7